MSIFLSYNTRDFPGQTGESLPGKLQTQIEERLKRECVFFDQSKLRPGSDWRLQIESALRDALVLVLLAGPRFFDDDQMRRLEDADSVIKHELLTAHRSAGCVVLPVSLGGTPPHKSGRKWPEDLAWLSDVQWVHLDDKATNSNLMTIVEKICDVLVLETLRRLRGSKSLVTNLGILCGVSGVVRNAINETLTRNPKEGSDTRTRGLRGLVRALGNLDDVSLNEAITGTGDFAYTSPEVRAIVILRNLGRTSDPQYVSVLRKLDEIMRPQLPESGPDRSVKHFVLLNVQRARETLEGSNLRVAENLKDFHLNLARSTNQDADRKVMKWLLDAGVCLNPVDRSAFEGRGTLRSRGPRVKGPASTGNKIGIIPRSRAPRAVRKAALRRGKKRR